MATIAGTGRSDILVGTPGKDIIRGLAGNDGLLGFAGADFLDGGIGNDVMRGGAGDDVYVVGSIRDVALERAGQGVDLVLSLVSHILGPNIENLRLTGSAISGTGNGLNNEIAGNSAANVLRGLGGKDILDGRLGADLMIGGAADDTYFVDVTTDRVVESAGGGTDTVVSRVTFVLGPNVEKLTLTGSRPVHGSGNDLDNVIVGNGAGGNILRGFGGDDIMFGGNGADTLYGGPGNDTYIATCLCDAFVEAPGQGTDLVSSSVTFSLRLLPNVEDLALTGIDAIDGFGNDTANVITGNGARNILVGGAGRDQLTGGSGNDMFRYEHVADSPPFDLADIILDFTFGDKIDLAAIDAIPNTPGDDPFTFFATNEFKGGASGLRYERRMIDGVEYRLVEADIGGDQIADMHLLIKGNQPLAAGDFVL